MALEDTLRHELSLLRGELRELKKCQLAYFTLAVGGSGLLLAVWGAAGGGSPLFGLVVILPCWWTFFDKATTITRLVGYVRVVERKLSARSKHLGYENALARFRSLEPKDRLTALIRHQYWTINWTTFVVLSFVILWLAFGQTDVHLWSVAAVATVFSFISTLTTLKSLRSGRCSYERTYTFWDSKVKP